MFLVGLKLISSSLLWYNLAEIGSKDTLIFFTSVTIDLSCDHSSFQNLSLKKC